MKRRWYFHILFWLAYWWIYAYTYSRYDGNIPKYLLTEGLQMPARIMATYACFWWIDYRKQASRTSEWGVLAGLAGINILLGWANRLLKMLFIVPHFFPDSSIYFWDWGRMMIDIFDCALASGVALSVRLFFRQQESLCREEQLKKEKAEAELMALKNQLQPHFLFNTINNLYALARIRSEKTATVALKLANLLRFVLYETQKPGIPIEQEIRILQDYIELEKIRFDEDRLRLETRFSVDAPQQPVTPLLLLPLVENAFKHGVSERRSDAWLELDLELKNGILRVQLRNSAHTEVQEPGAGIGLNNLRRQLQLVYPGRHRLETSAENGVFSVYLDIYFKPPEHNA